LGRALCILLDKEDLLVLTLPDHRAILIDLLIFALELKRHIDILIVDLEDSLGHRVGLVPPLALLRFLADLNARPAHDVLGRPRVSVQEPAQINLRGGIDFG